MLVLRGEFGLAKKPRSTSGCPSVNHILSNMIQEDSEEFAAKMVKTGLVSNNILQKMLPKAENAEMLTLKAYMLNQLNLNGVHEEKISYAI